MELKLRFPETNQGDTQATASLYLPGWKNGHIILIPGAIVIL